MNYYMNSKVTIKENRDKYIFMNPENGAWLKTSEKVKKFIDDFLQGLDTSYIPNEKKEEILLRFVNSNIITCPDSLNSEPDLEHNFIKSIYFFITRKCNLKCDFCSMNSGPEIMENNQLSLDNVKLIISNLARYSIGSVVLTGGEPILRHDLPEIIDYIYNNLTKKIIISTNGILLTDKFIKEVASKLARIDISLENIFEEDAGNDKNTLIRNIEKLKNNGIPMGFSYVLTSSNFKNINQFIDTAVEYDAGISIKIVAPLGKGRGNTCLLLDNKEIMEIYKQVFVHIYNNQYDGNNIRKFVNQSLTPAYSCSAKDKIFSIYPDGNVYSCHSLCYQEFCLGNILRDGIDEIFSNRDEKRNSQLYQFCFDIDQRSECSGCEVKYFCRGACFAEIYKNPERQGKLPPECGIKKRIIKFNLWEYDSKIGFFDNLSNLIKELEYECKES